jgi:hypothetical protein
MILPKLASQIARITGVSHQRLTNDDNLCVRVCGAGVWTQGLHLEPLHQPFFMMGFSEIGSRELLAWAGLKLWSSWSLPPE